MSDLFLFSFAAIGLWQTVKHGMLCWLKWREKKQEDFWRSLEEVEAMVERARIR